MKKILLSLATVFTIAAAFGQNLSLPVDFESTTATYTFTNFDGGNATVISNPQSGGINTSSNVGQMIKAAGQVWGGSLLEMANPIDFSVNKKFTMKVYSPRAGARVLLKVENSSNAGIFFEKEDTSTVANSWETLEFDYSAINTNNQYSKVVLILDLGVMGDSSSNFTFLFDDIELVLGSTSNKAFMDLPITWDDTANVNYSFVDFGGNASSFASDPSNASNIVLKSDKTANAQTWGGTSFGNFLVSPIPFASGNTTMKILVYSPTLGAPVRLKVEDQTDPTISVETEVLTTVANAWDTLTFNFANHVSGTSAINFSNTYDKVSIFYNFGVSPTAVETYYADNVWFDGGTTPPPPAKSPISLPITWNDTNNVDYTVLDFGGNASSLGFDPSNSSNVVLQTIKTSGAQTWGGTTLGNNLSAALPFANGNTTVMAVVYSPAVGVMVRVKVEDKTNPNISVETETPTTKANAWDTLSFDFSNEATGTAAINFANTYDKMSIFYNFGVSPTTNEIYYLDNVSFGPLAVGISILPQVQNFEVFPNPSNGIVNISIDETISNLNGIEVFSNTGQLVYSSKNVFNNKIDLTDLDNGLYIIKIATDKGQRFSKVFIAK